MDILHDKVNVLLIIISLIILYNVWMIKLVENGDFLHDAINIVSQLLLVQYFDCNEMIWVKFVVGLKDSSKGTDSKDLSLCINMIVLLQLVYSLLFASLIRFDKNLAIRSLRLVSISC